MARYHVNNEGNPGICRARKQCPFGDLTSEHYDNAEAARAAYEASQAEKTFTKRPKSPWADHSLEELQALEMATFEEKMKSGENYTDEEYDRHREYIRKVDSHYPSTHKQHTRKVKGKTVYTDERLQEHERLLAGLEKRFAKVPSEGKVVLSGGMPGAGKTTTLKKAYGEDIKNYAIINPDEIKEAMIHEGLAPKIPGLAPLEASSVMHYESMVITEKLYDRMASQGKNLIIDRTMMREKPILDDLKQLKELGYKEVTAVFVDVEPDVAYSRIVSRHREGLNEYAKSGGKTLGERMVRGTIIVGSRTDNENFYSVNSETFSNLSKAGVFTDTKYFDNN